MKLTIAALAIGLGLCAVSARAQQITGAGATFPYPVISKWSATYAEKTGVKVNYQSIGSGGGIAQIKAATVDFGMSDAPLPPDKLAEIGLAQFPLIIGAVVPVVNLEGVKPGEIRLSGPLLADIFLGNVKKWNDERIRQLNPKVNLPDVAVTVVHRSDGSGTTFNWVNFLSKVSPEWKTKVGEGTSVSWPTGVGGKGNEGVAEYVNRIKGSIGYVEYAYVLQNKMTYTAVENAAGKFPAPDPKSFQAAAATADWDNATDYYLIMTNAPGPDAWPIAATSFVLMYKQPKDRSRSTDALKFFQWSLEHGQDLATQLDYIPLPKPLVDKIEAYWKANIKN